MTPRGLLLGFASRLRFPWLFALTAALLVANLLIPDPLPLLDELLLGLLTLLFAAWRRQRGGASAAPPPP